MTRTPSIRLPASATTSIATTAEIVSTLLLVDPDDGSIEVAAMGVRNVQRMEFMEGPEGPTGAVAFADIGGVTAEEVNVVPVADLMDTSTIENFGWGRNADGLAREGTFYVSEGLPLAPFEPAPSGVAPVPEPGFIQPHAQYGRLDVFGGVAVSGPVSSAASFDTVTTVFGDLATGFVYATTDPSVTVAAPVYRVNLVASDGTALVSLGDLVGGRADPRFFRFADGTAGVLLEATGDLYRLTER